MKPEAVRPGCVPSSTTCTRTSSRGVWQPVEVLINRVVTMLYGDRSRVGRDHRRAPPPGRPLRVPRRLASPDRPAARSQPAERRRARARRAPSRTSRPAGSTGSRERLPVPRFFPLLLVCLVGRPAPALAQLELQAFLGTSVSAPSPLWITQRGQPGLDFTAHWATRPFARHVVLRRAHRALVGESRLALRFHAPQDLPDQSARGDPEVPDHERDEHVHAEPRVPARPVLVRAGRRTGDHLSGQPGARSEAPGRPRIPRRVLPVGGQPDGERDPPVSARRRALPEPRRAGLGLVCPGAGREWPRVGAQPRPAPSRGPGISAPAIRRARRGSAP